MNCELEGIGIVGVNVWGLLRCLVWKIHRKIHVFNEHSLEGCSLR